MSSEIYSKEIVIPASQCKARGRLGYASCFDMFLDIAEEHAEQLGVGLTQLAPKHEFWLTARNKIMIRRMPQLTDQVTVSTWPLKPERVRCERDYRITSGEEILVEGRTQWAVIHTDTGKLEDVRTLFPAEMDFPDEPVEEAPFTRFKDDFTEEPFKEYIVRSNDIDLGGHMNNVAYVRSVETLFSNDEWTAMDPVSIELQYVRSCFEGDTLVYRKRETEDGIVLNAKVNDVTVLYVRIVSGHSKENG